MTRFEATSPRDRLAPFTVGLTGAIALAVAMGVGRFFYTPVLPAMMTDLSLGPAEAGYIASANYLGYLAGAVLAAYGWAEGIERKVAIAGLAATVVLLVAMGVTSDSVLFSLIRFLAGVASALAMVFTSSIVLSYGQTTGGSGIQAMHFGGVGAGIAVSSLIFAAVVLPGGGWRAAWILSGTVSLAGLAYVALRLPKAVLRDGPAQKEPPLAWTPPFIAFTIAYGLFGFGYIVTATFLIAIVREGGGSAGFEALVWLVTGLAAAPSVAFWAPFARRFGLIETFIAGCLVEAAGVAASVLLPVPVGPLLGGLLLGATFVALTAYGLQAGRVFAGRSVRRAFALMTAAFGLGQIIGPVVAGNLAHLTGNYVLASMSAVLALFIACGLAFAIRRSRA